MGYVDIASAAEGTALTLAVRGIARPARVVQLPFVPHRYHRTHPNQPPRVGEINTAEPAGGTRR
jgi:hypothetical protein